MKETALREATIRQAHSRELGTILGMLENVGLPSGDIRHAAKQGVLEFLVADSRGGIFGAVGLELYPPAGLLRSLVVSENARGSGLGTRLLKAAEQYARERGARRLYLLTTTAAGSSTSSPSTIVTRPSKQRSCSGRSCITRARRKRRTSRRKRVAVAGSSGI